MTVNICLTMTAIIFAAAAPAAGYADNNGRLVFHFPTLSNALCFKEMRRCSAASEKKMENFLKNCIFAPISGFYRFTEMALVVLFQTVTQFLERMRWK